MEQNKNLSLGQRIAKLRKEKGITQLQLAQELYVSDKAISKWENDEGSPSIDNLIELSKYFDVSIDYLLKGKEPEKEVVTISRLEFCAKNDDVNMLKQLTFRNGYFETKDEDGKSIAYYIVKYESGKLFKEIIDDVPSLHNHLMKEDDGLEVCDKASFIALKNGYSIIGCQSICIGKKAYKYMLDRIEKTGMCFDILSYDEHDRFSLEKSKIDSDNLSQNEKQKRIHQNNEYLRKTFKEAKKIFHKALNYAYEAKCYKAFECLLDEQIKKIEKYPNASIKSYRWSSRERKTVNDYVTVYDDTINYFLDNGCFDIVRKINKINEYGGGAIVSEHDIEIKRQRLENILSEDEIKENEVVFDGILSLERLFATNDFPFIVKMLEKHPVNLIPLYDKYLKEGNYKDAFKLAVDSGDRKLSELIKSRNRESINKYLCDFYWNQRRFLDCRINKRNLNNIVILDKYAGRNYDGETVFSTGEMHIVMDLNVVLNYFEYPINRIIKKAKLGIEATKKIKRLNKEYFEKELSKGNVNDVILGLYDRIEAVVRFNAYGVEITEQNILRYNRSTTFELIKEMRDLIIQNERKFNKSISYQIQGYIETVCKDYICKM